MPINDSKRKVALVTGSRDWLDRDMIWEVLENELPDIIIHGACPTGADDIAGDYACDGSTNAFDIPMAAQWDSVKPRATAGPIRNSAMVAMLRLLRDQGHECVVLAFPIGESPGTRDCMRKAKAAGFTIFVTSGTD